MSDIEYALAVLLLIFFCALPVWWIAERIRRKLRAGFRYNPEVADRIEEISYLNQQARQCEELHTDIDLANPYQLQGLTLHWNSGSGASRELELFADGESQVTEELRRLAGERLSELTSSLSDKLNDLNRRTNGIGNGNVTGTTNFKHRGGGRTN